MSPLLLKQIMSTYNVKSSWTKDSETHIILPYLLFVLLLSIFCENSKGGQIHWFVDLLDATSQHLPVAPFTCVLGQLLGYIHWQSSDFVSTTISKGTSGLHGIFSGNGSLSPVS